MYLIKTKANPIVSLEDKEEFDDDEISKQLLNKVIDRIVIKDKKLQ